MRPSDTVAGVDAGMTAAALRVAVNRMSFALRHPHSGHDLTPSRYTALSLLSSRGSIRAGDIAEAMGITPASTSRLVESLIEGQWATSVPDPADGRARLVELTAHGREVFDTLKAEVTSDLSTDIAALDPEQQEAIANALPALLALADLQLASISDRARSRG
jgi:DNA-binding MarR family transcriptional regulator